jgi:predicted DNA binding protein
MISTRVYAAHPDLALTATIRACPDAEISVVSDVATDPRHDVYYFRAVAPEFERVESALATDHTVADWSTVLEADGRRTYRIEYSDDATLLTPQITERDGLTLATESYLDGWMLHLQLDDRDALGNLEAYARENEIRFEILELTQRDELGNRSGLGLTEAQVETLVTAYRHGYYDEPRDVSMEELAALLGLSPTAVSGRLRRGSAALVEEFLDREPN